MNPSPTGRTGPWPHAKAVEAFLRHQKWIHTPRLRDVARHEAGHVVVAHALGLPTAFVTARPSKEGPGHHRHDKELTPMFAPEERMLVAFGGRAADERSGLFRPVHLFSGHADDAAALAHAMALADGDPQATGRRLVDGLAETRRMVGDRWPEILCLSAELEQRDLDGPFLESVLGPLPEPRWTRTKPWGVTALNADGEVIEAALIALLAVLPYGLAFYPSAQGGLDVAWISPTGAQVFMPHRR